MHHGSVAFRRKMDTNTLVFCSIDCGVQASDDTVRAGFRRLTRPTKAATYTPAELLVLINRFDTRRVPVKRLTRVLALCLENKVWKETTESLVTYRF